MKLKTALLLIWLLGISCAWAQEKRVITGKVTDRLTGEPLVSVNIFLANTTIGTSSGADGSFRLQNIPEGKYDLIASSVGYKPYFLSVDLSGSQTGFTKEIKIDVILEADVKELNEITVRADTTHWTRNYNDFKKLFIGQSRLAKSCEIVNPKVLHFYFDASEGVLIAHAKKPLEIIQKELGYKINYYLYQFEYKIRTGELMVYGIPYFEELPISKERLLRKRERERKKAYEGSVSHFMRSLVQNQLKENGFEMRRIFVIKNKKRPPTEIINQKIKRLRDQSKNGIIRLSTSPSDSLSYYIRLSRQPEEIDSVAPTLYSGQEFWNTSSALFENIKGKYEVKFDAQEEIEYLPIAGRKTTEKQKSQFNLLLPTLKIYRNGYYEDVRSLFLTGYLSWHEKIATLLPLEYEPNKD